MKEQSKSKWLSDETIVNIKAWASVALIILVFYFALVYPAIRNARNDCIQTAQSIGMEPRYAWPFGCTVKTPEFGWHDIDEYIRLRGLQVLIEEAPVSEEGQP